MRRPAETEWADLFAGRLDDARRAELLALAERDPAVAATRDRIARVARALEGIGAEAGPELPWDHVGARVHWEVSLARRRPQARRPRYGSWALAIGGCAAIAGILLFEHRSPAPVVSPAPAPIAEPPVPQPARPLGALLTLAQGQVMRDGVALDAGSLDRPIEAGTRLSTREGRVAVQFEVGGAFEIGPDSAVVVRSLDSQRIELAVEGRIDVEVSHRDSAQTFVVTTRLGEVSVRGTRFRVDDGADGELAVLCTRGEVAFRSARGGESAVSSGHRLRVKGDSTPSVVEVPKDQLDALDASLDVPMIAGWDDAARAARATGFIGVGEGGAVAINGIAVGATPVWMRVGPGRHHVAVSEGDRWSPGGWVELGAGGREAVSVAEIRGQRARADGAQATALRRGQLARALEAVGTAEGCLRGLRKRGLAAGAFIDLDIGINRDGSQRYLNVSATDLPPAVRKCVVDAVDGLALGAGPAVRLRHRLTF